MFVIYPQVTQTQRPTVDSIDLVYKPIYGMFNKINNIFKNTFVDPVWGIISSTMSATII